MCETEMQNQLFARVEKKRESEKSESREKRESRKSELTRKILRIHPIPKIGEGKDFGDISSFLLSEKNSWITGQIFHIDGGRSTLRIKA